MSDTHIKNKVVIGVTGSIAAYKAAELARQLISRGYQVRVVMSEAAQKFITATTFEALTGERVLTGFWDEEDPSTIGHIELADWADVIVIAPATADAIASLAAGAASSALLAVCLATKAPILVAPAMNVNMFEHPATQANIETLKERGVKFINPESGALACGWSGAGRLADPWEIFYHTLRALAPGDFAGRKFLISTGPTREAIDPVRYLSNRSSGKMGVALAREAFRRGAEVTLVHGPVKARVPSPIECVKVRTAKDMRDAMLAHAFPEDGDGPDVVIMAAAVADFRPAETARHKIKKTVGAPTSIELAPNDDVLSLLGEKRKGERSPILVGFAVETGEIEELLEELTIKLKRKGADLIVGNLAEDAFGSDTNRVWIIDRDGKTQEIATTFKSRVALQILNRIAKF
jgi:phosphopantothenoylcysteine decarboxylase/phosphopantothenate--cysteine ligase